MPVCNSPYISGYVAAEVADHKATGQESKENDEISIFTNDPIRFLSEEKEDNSSVKLRSHVRKKVKAEVGSRYCQADIFHAEERLHLSRENHLDETYRSCCRKDNS